VTPPLLQIGDCRVQIDGWLIDELPIDGVVIGPIDNPRSVKLQPDNLQSVDLQSAVCSLH
jgi:hypothetical protein